MPKVAIRAPNQAGTFNGLLKLLSVVSPAPSTMNRKEIQPCDPSTNLEVGALLVCVCHCYEVPKSAELLAPEGGTMQRQVKNAQLQQLSMSRVPPTCIQQAASPSLQIEVQEKPSARETSSSEMLMQCG